MRISSVLVEAITEIYATLATMADNLSAVISARHPFIFCASKQKTDPKIKIQNRNQTRKKRKLKC